MVLLVPDHVRETFEPAADRAAQMVTGGDYAYLEWTYDPDDSHNLYTTECAYVLREGNQPAWVEHEQHVCGNNPHTVWLRLLCEVGFQPEIIRDDYDRDIFMVGKVEGLGCL